MTHGDAKLRIRRAARIAAWILAATIVALSVVPPVWRPTVAPHWFEHFVIYFVTGFAFGLGYKRTVGLQAALLVIFSGSVEIMQLFVPGRHARLSDFIVDALAVCFGLMVVYLLNQIPRQNLHR